MLDLSELLPWQPLLAALAGGSLALGGTTYLAFSANKRESIAAAGRQFNAWLEIARGRRFWEIAQPGGPGPYWSEADWSWFTSLAPYLWGDPLWSDYNTLAQGLLSHPEGFFDVLWEKLPNLFKTADQRVLQFAKIVEDMKRRSAWGFWRTVYIHQPERYRFHKLRDRT